MVDYMHSIAADDFDEMIELLEYKFKKFRSLFRYLSKYSDDIVDISQSDGGHHELICVVTFSSNDVAEKVYHKAAHKEFEKLFVRYCHSRLPLFKNIPAGSRQDTIFQITLYHTSDKLEQNF